MDRFRQLKIRSEIFEAAIQAGLWGYPRDLEDSDLAPDVLWFRLGEACIFWCELLADGTLYFHVCANGGLPKRHPANARRLLNALEFIADMQGCWRIMASDCQEGGEVASYLLRMGFEISEECFPGLWYERRLINVGTERTKDLRPKLEEGAEEEGVGAGSSEKL